MLLNLLLVLEVIVSFFLIVVVLLQRSEGGGFVSGGTSSLMSVRGAGDLLTRTTWILGTAFFVLGLLLTIMAGRERGASSVVDRLKVDPLDATALKKSQAPQPVAPGAPGEPAPTGSAPFQAPAPAPANPFGAPAPAPSVPAPVQPPAK